METNDIINALRAFVEQRPGLEPVNYGSWTSYRQESREVTRDLHDAREILNVARWTVTADDVA
jgi:hypothetical protein